MKDKALNTAIHLLSRIETRLLGGQAVRTGTQLQSNLILRHYRGDMLLVDRNLGAGLVTNAGVTLWAADWNNATATIKLANYHDSGTGVTAPTTSDTILQTPTGIARVTGSQSTANNVYSTVGVIAYGGTFTISEWGLFTDPTIGTLFDHRTFTAIPVVAGDSIQYTYQLTIISGG